MSRVIWEDIIKYEYFKGSIGINIEWHEKEKTELVWICYKDRSIRSVWIII